MAFYGPMFPNETHYERLSSGRQRFGNRSANMFFVRPARHIACPRRLKYIHDIKTGYIPYVEDSAYDHQSSYRYGSQKVNDDDKSKSNGLGLYNSADVWREELMDLAQQVKTALIAPNEHEFHSHPPRSSRLHKHHKQRSASSALSHRSEDNDEVQQSKRVSNRRISSQFPRCQTTKPKSIPEKCDSEPTNNDENQDPGIWLIPLLCYVLQIDNITDAQDWLINANPTEKRLAMELMSRTMQDLQNHENEMTSDVPASDLALTPTNFNQIYWPYKLLQRQEKQHVPNLLKLSKSNSHSILPPLTGDNGETCERATSPFRMVTPAKRSAGANQILTPADTMTIERSLSTRQMSDRATPVLIQRQTPSPAASPIPVTDRIMTVPKRPLSTMNTSMTATTNERQSRRGYRVATSLNHSANRESPTLRGKTPLI